MRKALLDVLDHTQSLGFITELRFTGEADKTLVETMNENQRVIIKGTLKTPLSEFVGEFGVKSLTELRGLVTSPDFKGDDTTINVVTTTRNGDDIVEKAIFSNPIAKVEFEHRFCSVNHVQEQFDFMGAPWNVTFKLPKSEINRFSNYASIYAGQALFTVSTVDGELRFNIGENGGGYITVPLEESVEFKNEMKWPMAELLSVLKLDEENAEISIFDDPRAAVLQVKITSKEAEWLYIFPLVRA